MLSKVTLANAAGEDILLHEDSNSSKRFLVSAQGLLGIGALRSSKRVRPSAHGSLNETSWEEGRTIALTGEVWGTSIENVFTEFRAVDRVLLETLDNGAALLKWTEAATGNKLQMLVKLDAEIEPILQEGQAFIPYATSLFAADPRAYTQASKTEVGAGITGTEGEQEFLKASAPAIQATNAVAIDAAHIYFANGSNIGRATLAGGTVEPEWVKTSQPPTAIAVNASNVFWTSTVGIGRCTLAGGTIENEWKKRSEVAIFGTGVADGLAIDAAHIYWHSTFHSFTAIGRMTLAGGSIETQWIPATVAAEPGTGLPTGLTVDASFIYWCQPNSIARATIAGASVELQWITGASKPEGVAVSATNIYWTNYTGNTIGSAAIGGTGVNQAFLSGSKSPTRIAVNASNIFYGNSGTGYIGRAPIAGSPKGSTVTVAQAGNRPTPLTLKINGPITNPAVVRESDGSRISLTGTINAGNYVEVNVADRTVKLNGSANALSMLNAANTRWQAFSPLASTKYFLTATSATAATLEATYRSAYA